MEIIFDDREIWMAVPDIIEWSSAGGYKYIDSETKKSEDDIRLEDFLNSLNNSQKKNITLDLLKKKRVYQYNQDNQKINSYLVYKCFFAELKEENKIYLLMNGKWYEIDSGFVNKVQKDYEKILNDSIKKYKIDFPLHIKGQHEPKYNKGVAKVKENFY